MFNFHCFMAVFTWKREPCGRCCSNRPFAYGRLWVRYR